MNTVNTDYVLELSATLADETGEHYHARACGARRDDGLWDGWIEFHHHDGKTIVRTERETTQPNLTDLEYWATGLTPVYLDGALKRALRPAAVHVASRHAPEFDGPKSNGHVEVEPALEVDAVLDPFSVYEKGEVLLRRELMALAPWHLVNIIEAYRLSDKSPAALNRLPAAALVDTIVSGVASARG